MIGIELEEFRKLFFGGLQIVEQITAFGNSVEGIRQVIVLRMLFDELPEDRPGFLVFLLIDECQAQVKFRQGNAGIRGIILQVLLKPFGSEFPAILFVQADGKLELIRGFIGVYQWERQERQQKQDQAESRRTLIEVE